MSRSKDLADSAEVINFLDNITTDINSGLTSKLSISTNLSDLADADVALVNLGLTATATELNYTDGVTSNIQTQLDTKLASASYTASDVLTKVKTVDGAASGLDADLLDGQHGSYYTGYTDTAISNLVDSAPGALDTLNELAAALGDDANFSTTVTNSIALKAPLASPTFTGTVTADGLELSGTTVSLVLFETDQTDLNTRFRQTVGDIYIQTLVDNASSAKNRLGIDHATGDISFYEDTGTTPKLFWDASAESLGIGTTTPSYTLDTYGAVASRGSGIGNAAFVLQEVGNNPWYLTQFTGGAFGILYNGTSSANTKLVIDTSGNVGIGTTSPSELLHIEGPVNAARIRFDYSGARRNNFIGLSGDADQLVIAADESNLGTNSYIAFRVDASEAIRIDSSGNLLVGKTATGLNNVGIELRADNSAYFTKASATPIFVNRNTSDGTLVEFRKDNAGIGSIGTVGSYLTIGSGTAGLLFDDIADKSIRPWNLTSNTSSDADTDLGLSNQRFKDAHFSGTVNANAFVGDGSALTNLPSSGGTVLFDKKLFGGI